MKGVLILARPTRCRLRQAWLFLPLVVTLSLLPATALANSAPPRNVGDTGGPLLPGQSDQVHVLNERLSFDLQPNLRSATVTARYSLQNRGPALTGQPFVFVVQNDRFFDIDVTWQGEAVPSAEVNADRFTTKELQEMERVWTSVDQLVDPVTGEQYAAERYFGQTRLRYYHFLVDLPAGARGELKVTYEHLAAYDRTRHAHSVYNYQYLLLPARGWASFGPLEIRVAAPPESRYFFASNLPFRFEEGEYRASFPGLPDENLAFAVMDRAGILFGLTRPAPYYWMGFAIVLLLAAGAGMAIGWLAGRLPSQGWAVGIGVLGGLLLGGALDLVLAILVLGAFPALREQSYGLFFIGAAEGLGGAMMSAAVAGRAARRTWRRRV